MRLTAVVYYQKVHTSTKTITNGIVQEAESDPWQTLVCPQSQRADAGGGARGRGRAPDRKTPAGV